MDDLDMQLYEAAKNSKGKILSRAYVTTAL